MDGIDIIFSAIIYVYTGVYFAIEYHDRVIEGKEVTKKGDNKNLCRWGLLAFFAWQKGC